MSCISLLAITKYFLSACKPVNSISLTAVAPTVCAEINLNELTVGGIGSNLADGKTPDVTAEAFKLARSGSLIVAYSN